MHSNLREQKSVQRLPLGVLTRNGHKEPLPSDGRAQSICTGVLLTHTVSSAHARPRVQELHHFR